MNNEGRWIMMIVGIILAIIVLVTALYGFGFFNTPLYRHLSSGVLFFLIFFLVTLAVGVVSQSNQGYDPTPHSRENPTR